MLPFHLTFLFILLVITNPLCLYSEYDENCCEARLWPDECLPQIFNGSSRNSMTNYCKKVIKLCCLLDQDKLAACDLGPSMFVSKKVCKQPEHCCVACQIGQEIADRSSDCSVTELKKFITKQDAVVLQISNECCEQRKQRRKKLKTEELFRSGKVLRFNRETNKIEDVDECLIKHNGCYHSQKCVNKYGSYICLPRDTCKNGYRFNRHSLTCDDNDECHKRRWACPHHEVCNNLLGSFTCVKPECPEGFKVSFAKRWSNYNKCVRKSCGSEPENCQDYPKYLMSKNVTLSTNMNVIKGVALYNIYTKRFKIKPKMTLEVFNNISKATFYEDHFDIAEKTTRAIVVLNKAINEVQELKIKIEVKIAEKVIEIVTINLSVRDN